jgi:hypothetical protein
MIKLSEEQVRGFLQAPRVQCLECGYEDFYLLDHLLEAHDLSAAEYLRKYPDAELVSSGLRKLADEEDSIERRAAPKPSTLTTKISGVRIPVNYDVPASACFMLPDHYRVPRHGSLAYEIEHVVIEFISGTHLYIYGMPGAGKDAICYYLSYALRIPAKRFPVNPNFDLLSWFHNRGFNTDGTFWEKGDLFTALTEGYLAPSGKRYPYLILLSDLDRANREQGEFFRLMTDTIEGQVPGPTGEPINVFPGTQIVATGNTAGAGDPRGRMISANPLDGSLLDRFLRIRLSWMDWKDEEPVCKAKFPLLAEKLPEMFKWVGDCTTILRAAIHEGEIFTEFSHRGVCAWLKHAENIVRVNDGRVIKNLARLSARVVLDAMPDEETREKVKRYIDPSLPGGALPAGSTGHMSPDSNLTGDFN